MEKFTIQGKGQISLDQNDFVSEGGEGRIYAKGKTAYKIYLDLSKMIPVSKIQELSTIELPNIIRPKDIILNKKNAIVGYTMDLVEGIPMVKLFSTGFRNRNAIKPESIVKLVENMISGIVHIHDKKCLLIDGNEMNYMSDDKTYEVPYFIDTNSYQTPSFPATVIMPSIVDWSSKVFTQMTDWFAFGIVSCQLFIGIHPYKGSHSNFKVGQLEERMKANISIFNKEVSVPSSCRDFSYIPDDIRNWYIDMFGNGKRVPPPKVVGLLNVTQVKVTIVQTTGSFEITFISEFKDMVIKSKYFNGTQCVTTEKELVLNKVIYNISSPSIDVVFTPKMLKPLLVKIENNKVQIYDVIKKERVEFQLNCSEKMVINNTIYLRNEGNLIELTLNEFNEKIVVSVKTVWNIMPKSSQIFNGVVYQSVLGKPYLVIPKPEISKNSSCQILSIPELTGHRIIDGKYENKVCMISTFKDSKYQKFIFRFDESGKYDCRIVENDNDSINFVVLDNGICISINHDDSIEVFVNDLKSTKIKCIQDPDVNSSMTLCKDGIRVMVFKENKLYSLKMK